ncbi:MAG: PD-(D/E)XK nuclease family protein [Candidatus Micrarchaeota archaeon]|nr:PD-(D/E)XK nuclease family protein [Candidatus Micrarchaeota archaeon]
MVEYIDFDRIIDRYLHREVKQRAIGKYYPSEAGQCMRKTWFNIKMPKPVEPEVTKVYEAGNLFHSFVVDVLKSEKNKEIKLLETELPLKYKVDDFEISGRIDDIIQLEHNGEKLLLEVKSTKSLDGLNEPSESYVFQLQFYLHVTGIKNGVILYLEKNTLKSKSFFLEYNPYIANYVIERFKKLHSLIKNNELPEAEAKKNPKKIWMCNFCPYRQECDAIEMGQQ